MTLKITTVGNSAGVVLPKELLQHLHVDKGDTLYAVETPNGIELTPYDPEFARQMEVAEAVLVQDLCVFPRVSEPHGDGGLPVAEDPRGRGSIQSFSQRSEHHGDLLGRGF